MSCLRKSKVFAVVVYVLFIYSTLGVIRVPQQYLKQNLGNSYHLSVSLFYLGSGLALVGYFLRRRLSWLGWLIITVAFAASFLLLNHCSTPEEKIHLVEYGLLSWLVYSLLADKWQGYSVHLAAAALVAVLGYFDELIQWWLPNRVYDNWDVLLNAVSGVIGQMLIYANTRKT